MERSREPREKCFGCRVEFSARHSNVIMVKEISSKEEFDKIIAESGEKLVAVDYTASWCG